jgi:hypothetical protein
LDDATVVHPGHGPATTIGQEKASNPFFDRTGQTGQTRQRMTTGGGERRVIVRLTLLAFLLGAADTLFGRSSRTALFDVSSDAHARRIGCWACAAGDFLRGLFLAVIDLVAETRGARQSRLGSRPRPCCC